MDGPQTSAVLVRWYCQDAATVRADEPLCELAFGTAAVDLPAPHAGRLRRLAGVGTVVTADDEIARVDPS